MIDKLGDATIRETTLQETSQTSDATESQAQETIHPEKEPVVQATPEYKSSFIAEQRLGGQMQEILLRNQVIDLDEPEATPSGKSPLEVVGETLKEVPKELGNQLGQIKDAWSDPAKALGDMATEAEKLWKDIKDGK